MCLYGQTMITPTADNILTLAEHPPFAKIEDATDFFQRFGIGKNSLGFLGIRLTDPNGEPESEWLCLSQEEVERAKSIWNPPENSDEYRQALQNDAQNGTNEVEKMEKMFVNIYDEPWRSKVCQAMEGKRKEAKKFLMNISNHEEVRKWMNKKINALKSQCFNINNKGELAYNPYATFLSLEDEIFVKFYLLPFLSGAYSRWQNTRVCAECNNLFFYKQERARYCSQKCRMTAANRERRKK